MKFLLIYFYSQLCRFFILLFLNKQTVLITYLLILIQIIPVANVYFVRIDDIHNKHTCTRDVNQNAIHEYTYLFSPSRQNAHLSKQSFRLFVCLFVC